MSRFFLDGDPWREPKKCGTADDCVAIETSSAPPDRVWFGEGERAPVRGMPQASADWGRNMRGKEGPTTVFVVDDHAVVRDGVRALLEETGGFTVVGDAGDVAQGVRGILQLNPDVALVDVRLPDGSGVEAVREVRSHGARTRFVMFTSFRNEEAFYQSVVAGACGFLIKDVPRVDVVNAVRTAAAGGSLIRRELIDSLEAQARSLPAEDELLVGLTPRERVILQLITEGRTNREIAESLFLAEKTVRNYVSNVLAKLGMKNRTQVAAYVAASAVKHGNELVRNAL